MNVTFENELLTKLERAQADAKRFGCIIREIELTDVEELSCLHKYYFRAAGYFDYDDLYFDGIKITVPKHLRVQLKLTEGE